MRAVLIKGAGGTFCVGGDVKSMAAGRAPLTFEAKLVPTCVKGMEVFAHPAPDGRNPWWRRSTVPRPAPASRSRCPATCVSPARPARSPPLSQKSVCPATNGGTYFLTKLLGSARARELYLMSPVLTAQEALALGMVTKVVPDAEVEAAAHELAMSLAQGPSVTLGYIKRNINNAETMSLEECFDGEAIHHSRSGETDDHKEAAKAFVEKRKPMFQGH